MIFLPGTELQASFSDYKVLMFKGENTSSTFRDDFCIKFLKRKQMKISKKATKSCSQYPNEKPISHVFCKSLTNLLEPSPTAESGRKSNSSKPNWTWSTPQLHRKAFSEEKVYERRKSSEWTKLKNTLEFIQKSRETCSTPHIAETTEQEPMIRHLMSLSFLGQLYDVKIEKDVLGEETCEAEDELVSLSDKWKTDLK